MVQRCRWPNSIKTTRVYWQCIAELYDRHARTHTHTHLFAAPKRTGTSGAAHDQVKASEREAEPHGGKGRRRAKAGRRRGGGRRERCRRR
eukprot:1812876-Alexandrium_andersonii.AAC.1